jgi:hypothetical protein
MALADKMRQASATNFQASDEYRDALEAAVTAHADEVESLKESAALWHKRYTEVCEDRIALQQKYGHEIAALEAEVEALRADALRYRWLRTCNNDSYILYGDSNNCELMMEEVLDQAIDARMALEKSEAAYEAT